MPSASEQEKIQQETRLKERMQKIKHKIIVMSGKGGVGKTTVAVNLAYKLALKGHRTGLLDVDIHGPNIAKMLGVEHIKLSGSPDGIEPFSVLSNLKAVSMAMLMPDEDQPIIWRGPLKMATIKQFLSDVNWGDLDYLIFDLPPGTGDEPLSVCQLLPDISGAIIVTTPQDVAILDSRKSVLFAKSLDVPVIGIIENMSGFICPHCQKDIDLFGQGGGEKAAGDLTVPFLGRIPMTPRIVKQSDQGKPFVQFVQDDNAAQMMNEIIDKILEDSGNGR
jgi:ATP-binding protein involved in chromosome partitioning